MSRQYTDEELEYCRQRLEDLGYHDSIELAEDMADEEPDEVIVIDIEDVLKGEI